MATAGKDLSSYDSSTVPSAKGMRIGIAVAEWNAEITDALLQGAMDTLLENGISEENMLVRKVPGSFELPLSAQLLFEQSGPDAVICLGSLIQGETRHFEFICQAVAQGITAVSLKFSKPVVFGVLTDNTWQQAKDRSGGKHGNKGAEAAITAIKMVAFSV